jgi:hypothetical protein
MTEPGGRLVSQSCTLNTFGPKPFRPKSHTNGLREGGQ